MSDAQTEAVIIPFPSAVREAAVVPDEDRLRRALRQLDAAIADQRRALSEWRFAITELNVGVTGLNAALGSYQRSLGEVQEGVSSLRGEARKLESWAEGVLSDLPARG